MAINYNEHTWDYGEEFTPDKLNNIEKGIKANADAINEVNNNLLAWQKSAIVASGASYSGFLADAAVKKSHEVQFVVAEKITNYYAYAFTFQTLMDNVLFASANVDAASNYCRVRYNRHDVNGTGQFDVLEMKVDGKLVDSSNMSIVLYYR